MSNVVSADMTVGGLQKYTAAASARYTETSEYSHVPMSDYGSVGEVTSSRDRLALYLFRLERRISTLRTDLPANSRLTS